MKYMGSKRAMLQNGLGVTLRKHAHGRARLVDLFCGGASVSWFAASKMGMAVVANDLQRFSAVLAGAVASRCRPLDATQLGEQWLTLESCALGQWDRLLRRAEQLRGCHSDQITFVQRARALCAGEAGTGVMWRAYGGHYFSPTQAAHFDCLLATLPQDEPGRTVCHAALIMAASDCAASPGHTAQPFSPTPTAAPFILEAWALDPCQRDRQALEFLCPLFAVQQGTSRVGDAIDLAFELNDSDLAFVDPPYSGVHYSRFYHVLETLARGSCGPVSGIGRYPPSAERPASAFSRKTESEPALTRLFAALAKSGCRVILTFPAGPCSNGLSGDSVCREADALFSVLERKVIDGRFSTLGGNGHHRDARHASSELVLVLDPR
jgi:adenine-specific DNA-methyltransferase